MSHTPLVSIVVVTWNAADLLVRLLESLGRSTYPAWECVVVDNGSTDDTLEVLARRFPTVRVVASGENLGPAGGNNAGARVARGDWLFFLNPDVVVEPDWLSVLIANVDADPDIGVAFPTIIESHGVRHPRAPQVEDIAAMQGAALGVRRPAFDALGGFDERLFMYYEDTQLCWRAWLGGWRVVKDHDAIVHHRDQGHSGGKRRAAMQIRNGILAYLWHMDGAAIGRFLVKAAAKSVVRGVRYRQPEVAAAWIDVARDLPAVLAERRRNLAATTPERRARLARLETVHATWQWRMYRRRIALAARTRLQDSRPSSAARSWQARRPAPARIPTLAGIPQRAREDSNL